METIRNAGVGEIWLGGSDIGQDDSFRWADGATIGEYYWADGFPKQVAGERFRVLSVPDTVSAL